MLYTIWSDHDVLFCQRDSALDVLVKSANLLPQQNDIVMHQHNNEMKMSNERKFQMMISWLRACCLRTSAFDLLYACCQFDLL